jgi:hypothetical protein
MLETSHHNGNGSLIVKILLPAGIAVALAVGSASLGQAIHNEHRLTAVEVTITEVASMLFQRATGEKSLDDKIAGIAAALARIEGALAERARFEEMNIQRLSPRTPSFPGDPKQYPRPQQK